MKVFILIEETNDYQGERRILGVYESENMAYKQLKQVDASKGCIHLYNYYYEEWEVTPEK